MRVPRHEHVAPVGLAIILALSLACGSEILLGVRETEDGPDASIPRVDGGASDAGFAGDACAEYANVLCELEQSCNLLVFRNLLWGDLATCKERRRLHCVARINAPGSNQTSTRVAACAGALSQFKCDDYGTPAKWPETCSIPPGDLGENAPCAIGAQCRGRACFPADGGVCGGCSTLPAAGSPCNNGVCDDSLQCLGGSCVAQLRQGDACRYGDPLCAYGLACLGGVASGQGKCLPNLKLGAPCDPGGIECDDAQGLTCDSATSRCRFDPGWPAAGLSCLANQFCRADAWCNFLTGKCEPKRREGSACGNTVGMPVCLPPATCAGNLCVLPNPSACQ
jgi:hypothetical protein